MLEMSISVGSSGLHHGEMAGRYRQQRAIASLNSQAEFAVAFSWDSAVVGLFTG